MAQQTHSVIGRADHDEFPYVTLIIFGQALNVTAGEQSSRAMGDDVYARELDVGASIVSPLLGDPVGQIFTNVQDRRLWGARVVSVHRVELLRSQVLGQRGPGSGVAGEAVHQHHRRTEDEDLQWDVLHPQTRHLVSEVDHFFGAPDGDGGLVPDRYAVNLLEHVHLFRQQVGVRQVGRGTVPDGGAA